MLALTINMTINKSLTINLTTGQALACRGRGAVINFDHVTPKIDGQIDGHVHGQPSKHAPTGARVPGARDLNRTNSVDHQFDHQVGAGMPGARGRHQLRPARLFLSPGPNPPTQGPSWGYLKVNFSERLSIFGDKRPRNGSKNGEMAPRTGTGYPHIGVCVVPQLSDTQVDAPQKRAHKST